ncbi:related to AMP-dependent synthetase and ligase [Fusarium fujikuroi]|nr:related to AMP-dependent synthetase and ligase [Fusarium fujikuroi]
MTSSKINLPDDILFSRLLKLVREYQDQTIVDDHSHGTQFGYRHVLDGTSRLLQKLQTLHGYTPEHSGDFFIAVLAPNGYEFIIAVLAVLAFGGVVVPMPTGALPTEAAYMLQQCNAQYLLVGPEQIDLGERIQAELEISTLTIEGQVQIDALPPTTAYALTPTMAGVLHARKTINKYARMAEAGLNDDICLIPSGAFWSVYFTKVFQMLLTGVRIEIQNFGRQYNLIWERFRAKTATKIVLSPTFWYGMMHYFQQNISQLPETEVQEYVEGARHLRDATATGAMPSKRLKEFWRDVRGERALKVLYGSTETQEISVCDGEVEFTENDLGTPQPGVEVKVDGFEGELLVKTPSLFLGYLNRPEDSAERFDSEGFFKTGDLVIRRDKKLIFQGRANMDLFKFYTYKVPRMQVEAFLTALPYILEGYVLPVADPHCDTRVASLVRLREGAGKVNLERIRSDLENELPAYQLPTVLRVLKHHEEVPRTWSGKLAMKKVVQKFFPQDSNDRLYDEATEVLDVSEFMRAKTSKLWDLSGMRQ